MQMVCEAVSILHGNPENITEFGKLLHESWLIKKGITNLITTDKIDCLYNTALKAGAIGGKVAGSGRRGLPVILRPAGAPGQGQGAAEEHSVCSLRLRKSRKPDRHVLHSGGRLIKQPLDTVILTGGQGSRLRTAVSDRPKTMASINGRPFLDLLLGHLTGIRPSPFHSLCGVYGRLYFRLLQSITRPLPGVDNIPGKFSRWGPLAP